MLILDTDHFSLLEHGELSEAQRLIARLSEVESDEEIVTTIVSFEEQTRGWLAFMARARTVPQQIAVYRRLKAHLSNYCSIRVLDFDEAAAAEFQRLVRQRLRIGTMDLRIAAIALSRGARLLSRNLTDFHQIPGSVVEDWTS